MINIKTLNYNKTKGLTYSNLTYQFTFKDNPNALTIINTIRRTIISKVPTIAFEPSIMQFSKNTSVKNNDQLRERLSQLPILNYDTGIYYIQPIEDYLKYIESKEFLNTNTITLYLNSKNLSKKILNITTKDIKYQINNKTVDNPYNPDYPIILLKLKENQEINCKLTGVIGTGQQSNIWSPVSNCFITYDDENELKLSINSTGQLNEFIILDKAIDNIIYCLNLNINKIKTFISKYDKMDKIEITIEDMTIGQLLNNQLQQDKRIKYAGVYQPSYLEKYSKIKLLFDKDYSIDDISNIIEENSNILIKLLNIIKTFNLKEMKKFI